LSPSSLLRRTGKTLLFLSVVLVVFLLLLELLLRTTHLFGAKVSWSVNDPLIVWRAGPGMPYWQDKENDHPIAGRINRWGWRDVDRALAKPSGVFRVAVLGDSFVEAYQVELEATSLLLAEERFRRERGLNVELMNFGRAGFSQAEELLVLQRDVMPFQPDMVILFFLPENDIGDAARETSTDLRRPFFVLSPEGKLVLDTSFRDSREYQVRSVLETLKNHSALLSLLGERLNLYRYQRYQKWLLSQRKDESPAPDRLTESAGLCTRAPPEAFAANYRLTKALIRAMADFCREQGVLFMLVALNTRAYHPDVEKELRGVDPTFDPFFFDRDLGAFAQEQGIPFLGLQEVFRTDFVANGEPLLWGHWNYRGHRIVADALVERLTPFVTRAKDARAGDGPQ